MERWARELSARLPRLRPGAYRVARPPAPLAHRAGHAWEQLALPAFAAAARAKLLLCPANLAPLASRRTVVVIHDAAALVEPAWYSDAYAAWQAHILPLIARRAVHVLTVSEFSRAELVERLGLEPAAVSVVPGGVGEAFGPHADAAGARAALGLRRPYVLCVAAATARKNLAALVPAARPLARAGVEVVVAGGGRPHLAAEARLEGLRRLGPVDDALLPGLYAGASVVVVPSRHEGFGLTALEAMASGVPVVAARAGALPETCGDAAVLVAPEPEPLRAALTGLLGDDAQRRRLAAAGRARARGFSWARTAATVDRLLTDLRSPPLT